MVNPLIDALAQALRADPRNGPLWMHYAELLLAEERDADALVALRTASEIAAVRDEALMKLIPLLRASGELSEALLRAEGLLERRDDPLLREELERIHAARGSSPAIAEAARPVRESK